MPLISSEATFGEDGRPLERPDGRFRFPKRAHIPPNTAREVVASDPADPSGEPRVLSAAVIPFAGIAFAYVGIETSLIVFAIPYAAEFGLSAD